MTLARLDYTAVEDFSGARSEVMDRVSRSITVSQKGLPQQGLIVDLFAGGGGASTGIERAFNRPVSIAVNHDVSAISVHSKNHPETQHYIEDVFAVSPKVATGGRPVDFLWASPTCIFFSRAKGGAPLNRETARKVRGLAWIVVKWAKEVRPLSIAVENVVEFQAWGRLGADGRADKRYEGEYFRKWCNQLKALGYDVSFRTLSAADFGAPTIRERLFIVCTRKDAMPAFKWPEPTHGPGRALAHRTAAQCIDWSIYSPSIFGRAKPLAENTLRRIARSIVKYVIDCQKPYIVGKDGYGITQSGTMIQVGYGERKGQEPRALDIHKPFGTFVCTNKHGVVQAVSAEVPRQAAYICQHNQGKLGRPVDTPLGTITVRNTQQTLVTADLSPANYDSPAPSLSLPEGVIDRSREVVAFLRKYYVDGATKAVSLNAERGTLTVDGREHQIFDIRMRVLTPREAYRAQGFPEDYIIDPVCEYKTDGGQIRFGRLPIAHQIARCGNSVCPDVAEAITRALFPNATVPLAMAA